MKSATMILAAAAAAYSAFAGAETAKQTEQEPTRPKIVTTIFPIYDWTRQIVGEDAKTAEIVLLQQNGTDLHSYTPTAADIRKIAAADLFVFVGGASDEWTERVLSQGGGKKRRIRNLLKTLGDSVKPEEIVEGMEHEHQDHDKDRHDDHDEHHDHDEDEIDEHVWLSLRLASKCVEAIAFDLAELDPANASRYLANAKDYCKRLAELDREYAAVVKGAKRKTILVADRFPFRYLADDYGIEYCAAFTGCSAESEASFKTIAFLAKKTDELGLPAILTIEGARHKIAETVRRSTKTRDQRLLTLDSLQSTGGDKAADTRYMDVMRRNLDTLKAALD